MAMMISVIRRDWMPGMQPPDSKPLLQEKLFGLEFVLLCLINAVSYCNTSKVRLVVILMVLLVFCLIAFPGTRALSIYYLLSIAYGVAVGVALPLLNALLFSASEPSMHGFNSNMTFLVTDAGYFIMPYLGGMLISCGATFDYLFYTAAVLVFLGLFLVVLCRGNQAEGK
jgi:hypothetical protein